MKTNLLTGSSGFLGNNLKNPFQSKSNLVTLGRHPSNEIVCDLSVSKPVFDNSFKLVIHNAGKAHVVPKNEAESKSFYHVNVEGTQNLLKGLEQSQGLPQSFVFISTVAVYGKGTGELVDENTSLLAQDPYGRSKIEAEDIIQEWGAKQGVKIAILRLPLVVGKHPPGNLGAMIKAIQKGYYFNIGNGEAKRSMVLAEDVAQIILKSAEVGGVFNLTDGYHPSYAELSFQIGQLVGKSVKNLPVPLAKSLAGFGSGVQTITRKSFPFNKRAYSKMTSSLTFSDEKAKRELGWNPKPVLEHLDELF